MAWSVAHLIVRGGAGEYPGAQRLLKFLRVAHARTLYRVVEGLEIDADVSRVALDRRVQLTSEPRSTLEEADVRAFAQREEIPHLLGGDVESLRELRDGPWHERDSGLG